MGKQRFLWHSPVRLGGQEGTRADKVMKSTFNRRKMACIHRRMFSKVFVNFLLDRCEKVYYNAEHRHLGKALGYMPLVKTMVNPVTGMSAYETEIIWEPGSGPKLVQRALGSANRETGVVCRTDPVPIPGFIPIAGSAPAEKSPVGTMPAGSAAAEQPILQEKPFDVAARNLYLETKLREMTNENHTLREEVERFRKRLGRVQECLRRAESAAIGLQNDLDLGINICQVDGDRP